MDKKCLLIIPIFLLALTMVKANPVNYLPNEEILIKQGFAYELNRYGYTPLVFSLILEICLMWEKGYRYEYRYEYSWIEGDILYKVNFLSDKYPNACVTAYILEEGSFEKLRDENTPMHVIEVKNEPRFGKHAGKIYGIAKPFYKVNENNEPPGMIVNINGVERYMWF